MSIIHHPATEVLHAGSRETAPFYVAGGTIPPDSPSYVERRADSDLYAALHRGEFCYVLTPRQMGKSSLMVRAARRLQEDGVSVAVLDLTAVGQNVTPEQWYSGLLSIIGRQLGCEEVLEEYWVRHGQTSPVQRWTDAIRDVVLTWKPHPAGPISRNGGEDRKLVLFLDEIDFVRCLPFPTDELFAAIRACYNGRQVDPALQRLTFCLLGVATPSDLIQDTRSTPFNIGRRIELDDFSAAEALPLAGGMPAGVAIRLLRRALYWTGGHPYLTQRLCQAAAETAHCGGESTATDVDRCTRDLFLQPRARQRDDNLLFVRDRLLRGGADVASLLDLYQRVRASFMSRVLGRSVREDDPGALVAVLRLSGIARGGQRLLRVRNRIYHRVFNAAWIRENLPDAERRRQRAAFTRGLVAASAVGGALTLVMASLAGAAMRSERNARDLAATLRAKVVELNAEKAEANTARRAADRAEKRASNNWEAAVTAARRTEAARRVAVAKGLEADRQREEAVGQRTLAERRQEQSLQHLAQLHIAQGSRLMSGGDYFGALSSFVQALGSGGMNPDQERVDRTRIAVLLRQSPRLAGQRLLLHGTARKARFSADGRSIAIQSGDQDLQIWDAGAASGRRRLIRHPDRPVTDFRFSPDDERLVISSAGGFSQIYDVRTGAALGKGHWDPGAVDCVAWSADGTRIATGLASGAVFIWNARDGSVVHEQPLQHQSGLHINALTFSRDGRWLASASGDSTACIWSVATGKLLNHPLRHVDCVLDAQFSPDGTLLATASDDGTARLWNVTTGQPVGEALRHAAPVEYVQFSPDGQRLVTAHSADGTARLWTVPEGRPVGSPLQHGMLVNEALFSEDSRRVITWGSDGQARVWDAETGAAITPFLKHSGPTLCGFVSRNLQHVTSLSVDGLLRTWEVSRSGGSIPTHGLETDGWCVHSEDGTRTVTVDLRGHAQLYQGQESTAAPLPLAHPGNVQLVTASCDARRIVTVGGRKLFTWDCHTGKHWALPLRMADDPVVSFSRNGERVLIGDATTMTVRDACTGKALAAVTHRLRLVNLGVLSADGEQVFTASTHLADTGEGKLWRVRDGGRRVVTFNPGARVMAAAFSPDGRRIAVGHAGGTARVWETATGAPCTPELRHAGPVQGVAFHPDGRTVATGSYDFTVRIWDSTTGAPRMPPLRHSGPVNQVSFSRDGLFLIAMGAHFVRVWDARTGEPVSPELHGDAVNYAAWLTPDDSRLLTNTAHGVTPGWDFSPDRRSQAVLDSVARLMAPGVGRGPSKTRVSFTEELQDIWTRLASHATPCSIGLPTRSGWVGH